MSETKGFIKSDIVILVFMGAYFGVTYPQINQDYSSGYESIRFYFIMQSALQAVFQLLLIFFQLSGNLTWIMSIRSGAIVLLFGMSIINCFLGLLSVWLILFICITGYLQFMLFFEANELCRKKQNNSNNSRYDNESNYVVRGSMIRNQSYNQRRDQLRLPLLQNSAISGNRDVFVPVQEQLPPP